MTQSYAVGVNRPGHGFKPDDPIAYEVHLEVVRRKLAHDGLVVVSGPVISMEEVIGDMTHFLYKYELGV